MIKLHLGCFHKKIYGFLNIDIRKEVIPDVIDNCITLEKFENNSVDLILTVHMLEHCTRKEATRALTRWYEILKPGGEIYISVPDLERVFKDYIYYGDLRRLQNFLYGSQKHPYDQHYTGYDEKTLREDLLQCGFVDVKRYDWRETEWSYIDSYEQAYYPHLDKVNGTLMSLNIKAKK